MSARALRHLRVHREEVIACRACAGMVGPPVIGPAVASPIYAIGQAPGPHEASLGRPFAYTAGKTLFAWMQTIGVSEAAYRERVYMSAVARCFPGKHASGRGDRLPSDEEIEACGRFVARELDILRPALVLPIGKLAIAAVLGEERKLESIVGRAAKATFRGHEVDVIALPHPSGLSAWPKVEPGKTLLKRALRLLADHPVWRSTFEER